MLVADVGFAKWNRHLKRLAGHDVELECQVEQIVH